MSNLNLIALKTAFNAYKSLADRRAELEAEINAIGTDMSELVSTMASSLPEGTTNFKAEGRTLTPVVGGGKSGNSNFLRGYAPKAEKTAKKVVEVLDLDAE
jgi:hypothetical protein